MLLDQHMVLLWVLYLNIMVESLRTLLCGSACRCRYPFRLRQVCSRYRGLCCTAILG